VGQAATAKPVTAMEAHEIKPKPHFLKPTFAKRPYKAKRLHNKICFLKVIISKKASI